MAKRAPRKKRVSALPAVVHADAPFYGPVYCPKATPEENLAWRIRWREAAVRDKGLQRDIRQAAFDDVLFFFNAMGWCFEPRSVDKIRPFCTWFHQDPAILAMDRAISEAEKCEEPFDLVVDKSRGQGATWMYLLVFLRRWLRDEMFSAGLVTRNEDLVDSRRDPDTLMWKVIWALGMLPRWMIPEGFDLSKHRSLTEHSLMNPANGATIVGYSATGDVARGGRKTVFAMDELAAFAKGEDYAALNSTQHVTNCRFLVSTYKGDSGAYFDAATQAGNAVRVILDWKENPTQNRKMYRMVLGKIIEVDPGPGNYLCPADYKILKEQHEQLRKRGYKIEGKTRSIWYNRQCLRPGATPRGIAEELDRDPKGSVAKVFSSEILDRAVKEKCRPPLLCGRLVYDPERAAVREPRVIEQEEGELKLWALPGLDGNMSYGRYVLGADISSGSGGDFTSNSVACVVDRMTGVQVAEWASNIVPPPRFAIVCVALARWFWDALLLPEANFDGGYMKALVEDIGYANVYYRDVEIVGLKKKTQKPGFWMTNDDVKLKLFEAMQEGMAEERFTPRSKRMLEECGEYEWRNGKIIHVASRKTEDEGAKGKPHADHVVAGALAWYGCEEEPLVEETEEAPAKAPEGSMAARLRDYDATLGSGGDPWGNEGLDIFQESGVSSPADGWG